MRRVLLIFGLLVPVMLLPRLPADACGDKLLVLGRGVRFQFETAEQPASILLYMHPGSTGSEAIGDTQLQSILRQAGHKLRSLGTREEIGEALQTGRYDIVLADFADAAGLDDMVKAAASGPVLLPFVYKGTRADRSAAGKRYRCVLKAPARVEHLLYTIDKAMELKLKQNRDKAQTATQTSLLR